MKETNDKESPEILSEIREAEHKRAENLMGNPTFMSWLQAFRRKYIADGFLVPFYTWDRRYSRPQKRIKEFGDFILSCEMVDKVFHEGAPRGWIRQESIWFWEYLVSGQEAIFSRPISVLSDSIRIEGAPAGHIWQELLQITTRLDLFGENGGGILLSSHNLDADQLGKSIDQEGEQEGEDGYIEVYSIPSQPRWIFLFHIYEHIYEEVKDIGLNLEIRPAWFHIANHAFFNIPIERLAVFFTIIDSNNKVNKIGFHDENLSNQVRDFIGKAMLNIPIELDKYIGVDARRRERQEMTWWLWRNVGHGERKKTLSYGEIAKIAETRRSSIQTAVERFSRRLKEEIDGKLLERLLRTAISLGLGENLTYNTLVKQGLAPARKREIDSFDELDKLI